MASRLKHPEQMTVAATAPNELDAGVIMNALEDAGIDSMMADYDPLDFRSGIPNEVEILVAQDDLERARRVLKLNERVEPAESPTGQQEIEAGAGQE